MIDLALLPLVLIALAAGASFVVSASVGLGGSLLLVPTLVLVIGAKEGIALAALLLGANNIFKVVAYRRTIPWRAALLVVVLTILGAWLGATAMVHAPTGLVVTAVLAAFLLTLVVERANWGLGRATLAPVFAFAAGATSGFSGTSGPLKGVAIRNLGLDRAHFVGAASVASLVGDLTKTAVFARAEILGAEALSIAAIALPLMLLGTFCGFRLNRRLGEQGFALFFWLIMTGYSVRLIASF